MRAMVSGVYISLQCTSIASRNAVVKVSNLIAVFDDSRSLLVVG